MFRESAPATIRGYTRRCRPLGNTRASRLHKTNDVVGISCSGFEPDTSAEILPPVLVVPECSGRRVPEVRGINLGLLAPRRFCFSRFSLRDLRSESFNDFAMRNSAPCADIGI